MARYAWIDRVLQEALGQMPGHPLHGLLNTVIAADMRGPADYWDMPVMDKLSMYPRYLNEPMSAMVLDVLRYHLVDYDIRYSELRRKPYLHVHFRDETAGYICPDQFRDMPNNVKYELVMRALAPAVIKLLERQ